jgi:hypothetical protein
MSENQKERDHAEGDRIILKRIIKKLGMKVTTGFIWLRTGYCEHGNAH